MITTIFRKRPKKENVIIIGRAGVGKVRHPWDHLPPCPHCSCRLLMVHEDKTLFSWGEPKDDVKIYCEKCERFVYDELIVVDPKTENEL